MKSASKADEPSTSERPEPSKVLYIGSALITSNLQICSGTKAH